jgi:hypothetical protein
VHGFKKDPPGRFHPIGKPPESVHGREKSGVHAGSLFLTPGQLSQQPPILLQVSYMVGLRRNRWTGRGYPRSIKGRIDTGSGRAASRQAAVRPAAVQVFEAKQPMSQKMIIETRSSAMNLRKLMPAETPIVSSKISVGKPIRGWLFKLSDNAEVIAHQLFPGC